MPLVQSATGGPLGVSLSSECKEDWSMRNSTSHKPALVHYFDQVVQWINWAWVAYRAFEKVAAMVEVLFM